MHPNLHHFQYSPLIIVESAIPLSSSSGVSCKRMLIYSYCLLFCCFLLYAEGADQNNYKSGAKQNNFEHKFIF